MAWLQQVQYALCVHFTTEIESYDGAIAGFEEEREHAPNMFSNQLCKRILLV